MTRGEHLQAQRRRAQIDAYGAPVVQAQWPGTCACGCGTKYRGRDGSAELVRWFGQWWLVPCVRLAIDAASAWSTKLDLALRMSPLSSDPAMGDRLTTAGHYLTKRMRRQARAIVAKSVAANGSRR